MDQCQVYHSRCVDYGGINVVAAAHEGVCAGCECSISDLATIDLLKNHVCLFVLLVICTAAEQRATITTEFIVVGIVQVISIGIPVLLLQHPNVPFVPTEASQLGSRVH